MNNNRPILAAYHDEIQDLIYEGESILSISKRFSVSKKTASSYINKYIDYPAELKQRNINKAKELNRNDEESVRKKVSAGNPSLEYVSGYTRKQDPIKVRCLICGYEFEINFHTVAHQGGGQCPHCNEQKREELARQREAERKELAEAKAIRRAEREAERKRLKDIWLENQRHKCPECGQETYRPVYCSDTCALRAKDRRYRNRREARIQANLIDTNITLDKLYERDDGTCYICGGQCYYDDQEVVNGTYIAGPTHPSIDHIIALYNGGEHSWDNVALAHLICNTKKGIR